MKTGPTIMPLKTYTDTPEQFKSVEDPSLWSSKI